MLSIDGSEEDTDERRGKGIYKKVMHAMELLNERGILFGVSTAVTRKNIDTVLNVAGHVFGGEILKLMDSVAYAVATKHAESNVVTARIDEIMFHKPVLIGTVVKCKGKVVFTGRSSMEVYISIEIDDIQNGRVCIMLYQPTLLWWK